MSLVVVTKDKLVQKRKASLKEEQRIDTQTFRKKWQLSDATQTLTTEKALGILAAPLGVLMSGIMAIFMIGIFVSLAVFRLLAKMLNRDA